MAHSANPFAVDRRSLFAVSALALGAASLWRPTSSFAVSQPSDWPAWAPPQSRLESDISALRARAVDIRRFGAACNGTTDDSAALERAIAGGAPAVMISGPMRLTRPVAISRGFGIFGQGKGPHLIWAGPTGSPLSVSPESNDPASFVRNIVVDGIHATTIASQRSKTVMLRAVNIRGLKVTRCTADGIGLASVGHLRMDGSGYDRAKGSVTVDPAVLAGFSPNSLDDLNEDIYISDNTVDYGAYQGSILRFNMARRVIAVGNEGKYAKISWWGGGAKHDQGGMPQFLRRVSEVYIADNTMRGANGGVYGNNGQKVVVARNRISDMSDVGVDFEGCMDCIAYDNRVTNAGNFCYSTFYVARNIVFRNNYGEQDGTIPETIRREKMSKIGAQRGLSMAALQSGGFATSLDAITVSFIGNEFVYSGPGQLGVCTPSYFGSMVFQGNRLRNVTVDWTYRATDRLVIKDNVLLFDRPGNKPMVLIGGSAPKGEISGNRVELATALPAESVAIGYTVASNRIDLAIRNNAVNASAARALPLVVSVKRNIQGNAQISGNTVGGVVVSPVLKRPNSRFDGNKTSEGRAITPNFMARGLLPTP